MLRGRNWARWLALAWIVIHAAMSALRMVGELAHSLLCSLVAYFLFHRIATRYSRFHVGRPRPIVQERPSSADAGGFDAQSGHLEPLPVLFPAAHSRESLGSERQSPLSESGLASSTD
jgi:hypothetical protein